MQITLMGSPSTSLSSLNCECVGNTPIVFQSHIDCSARYSNFFGPSRDWERFSIECNQSVASSIPVLCRTCSPSAIFLAVISVIVDTIKRMSRRWSIAHIRNEVFKRLPALTNFNSSAPVSFIRMVIWSSTSIVHIYPCSMFRSFSVSMANSPASLARLYNAFFLSVPELASFAHKLCATIATTKPKLLVLVSSRGYIFFDNKPLTKSLAGKVNWFSQNFPLFRSSPIVFTCHSIMYFCFGSAEERGERLCK